MSDKAFNEKTFDTICPSCNKKLEYRKSSFEQFEPSDYKCEGCGNTYSVTWVKAWHASRKQAVEEVIEMLWDDIYKKGMYADGKSVKEDWAKTVNQIDEIRKRFED
jgi:transposase-like protein